MFRKIALVCLPLVTFTSSVYAQEPLNVQKEMARVLTENLQVNGVERQQQITALLRKHADNLAAIREKGFEVREDGTLERVEQMPQTTYVTDPGLTSMNNGGRVNDTGMFDEAFAPETEVFEASIDVDTAEPHSTPTANSELPVLRSVSGRFAVFETGGRVQKVALGQKLPGGYELEGVHGDSVTLSTTEGSTTLVFIDWTMPKQPKEHVERFQSASEVQY